MCHLGFSQHRLWKEGNEAGDGDTAGAGRGQTSSERQVRKGAHTQSIFSHELCPLILLFSIRSGHDTSWGNLSPWVLSHP